MQRGQTSIEFIFLILIIIVYIVTVTLPLSKDTQNSLSDVENLSRANNETQKLVNSINNLSLLGEGSKETITLFLPQNTTVYCGDNNISFEVKLKQLPYPAQCPLGVCAKKFATPENTAIGCNINSLLGPAKLTLIIEKTNSQISITRGS